MYRINRRFVLVSLGAALTAACHDANRPLEPEVTESPSHSETRVSSSETVERPHEAEFHRLSQEIRSFGGYHFDEQGNLIAYLKDPADEGRARQLLEPILRNRVLSARQRAQGSVVFRRGAFTFLELSGWRDRATDPVLDTEGVEYTDLDEAQNRFVIGVSSASGRDGATRALREHGVPLTAVVFEETRPAVEELTLRDYHRPLQGGYQIRRAGGGNCTLGFNAYWNGQASFLTNSHCTRDFLKYDGVAFYQNNNAIASHLVGYESHDPAPKACGIFGIFKCRWSDAAVVRKLSSVPWNYGYIARTTGWATGNGNAGSITVNSNNPRMRITGELSFPKVGDELDKIGRTTGWTYGSVKKTCVDVNKPGLVRMRCQDFRWKTHSNGGDSGSPVFRWHGNTVTLAGIHWGRITQGGTEYRIMSAMWNVRADLGPMNTF
jgi:hypothetical protein